MNDSRLRFNVIFSINEPDQYEDICNELGSALSYHFGGVTFLGNVPSVGFWTNMSDQFLSHYSSGAIKEAVIVLTLSVMPDDKSKALETLKSEIQKIKHKHNTNTRFVHIESQTVSAHHLDLG